MNNTDHYTNLLESAQSYAARGWPVHPVKGKTALLADWPNAATTDQSMVAKWWGDQYKGCNIALATGRSGFFVLDIDKHSSDGEESLIELEQQYGALPETVEQLTGGGGRHLLFKMPQGITLPNRSGIRPGIDIKATGGYIVASPSFHPETGAQYAWEVEHHPSDQAIADAPEWLIKLILTKEESARETESVSIITEGGRNDTLASLAGTMRKRGMAENEILAALLEVNHSRCRPPLSDKDVKRIAASISRYEPAEQIDGISFRQAKKIDRPPIEVFTAAELSKMDLKEPDWIIPKILPVGLSILAGGPKVGKSWLALDWALTIALGAHAMGKIKVEKRKVLGLFLEDTKHRLLDRLTKLANGVDLPSELLLMHSIARVDQGGLSDLRGLIEKHKPALVVVDTFQVFRRTARDSQNAYAADYAASRELKELADAYEMAVLCIHHLRKQKSGSADQDFVTAVSGSSGLTGAADSIMGLARARMSDTALLKITGRDVQEAEFSLKKDKLTNGWTLIGTAEEIELSNERKEILDVLREYPEGIKPADLAKTMKKNAATIRGLLIRMYESGDIRRVAAGCYAPKDEIEPF